MTYPEDWPQECVNKIHVYRTILATVAACIPLEQREAANKVLAFADEPLFGLDEQEIAARARDMGYVRAAVVE